MAYWKTCSSLAGSFRHIKSAPEYQKCQLGFATVYFLNSPTFCCSCLVNICPWIRTHNPSAESTNSSGSFLYSFQSFPALRKFILRVAGPKVRATLVGWLPWWWKRGQRDPPPSSEGLVRHKEIKNTICYSLKYYVVWIMQAYN